MVAPLLVMQHSAGACGPWLCISCTFPTKTYPFPGRTLFPYECPHTPKTHMVICYLSSLFKVNCSITNGKSLIMQVKASKCPDSYNNPLLESINCLTLAKRFCYAGCASVKAAWYKPHLISVLRRALKKRWTEKFGGGRGADCKGEVE